VPGAAARTLAAKIPGAEVAIIDGAHHYPHLDHAEEFNARVGRFLAGLADE
jgi:pimeloyl-ACP methyl ester carboxylesterase